MPPDDPDDPIWGKEPEPPPPKTVGAAVPKMFTSVGNNSGLVFRAARLPDPTTIPPRQWLYGTQLVRGSVSVLVAPGGVGKTAYSMGIGLALAANRQIFDEKIFQQVNVAVLNLEEPMDELERRLAALMIHHAIDREAVERRYFLYSGDDRRITIAAMSTDGFDIVFPDAEAMIREIQAHEIGVLVVDPFAESHALEENSNSEMIKAAAAWRRIARGTGCAILLIHHVRKGAVTDIDAARGAKALTDSARVGLLLSAMTSEEATEFDVPDDERSPLVPADDDRTRKRHASVPVRRSGRRYCQLASTVRDGKPDDLPVQPGPRRDRQGSEGGRFLYPEPGRKDNPMGRGCHDRPVRADRAPSRRSHYDMGKIWGA
jgi:hypothetical protein